MTSDRDIERVLDHWFTERRTQVADRVFDGVADRIARQPQQPAWRVSRRDTRVNSYLKPMLAVAAVVLIAVVGYSLLPREQGVGGDVSPTPSQSAAASASPSTAPSATAVFPDWYPPDSEGAGILPAGLQTTSQFIAGTTFTVPEGWVNDGDNDQVYYLFPDTPANEAQYARSQETAQNMVLVRNIANNMFAFCGETGLFQGATAAEVIDFVGANEALSATEPVEVTIGGLSGLQVDVQLSSDWTGSCPPNPDDPTRDYLDARNRVIVLDTLDGRTIGIAIGSNDSADFDAFLADAMPIVESLDLDLP